MALSGLDYLFVDMEHGPNDYDFVQSLCMAVKGTGCVPIVRVPANDVVYIRRVLDVGAAGVILPWINTVEDMEYGVAACKYPPEGTRGYGPRRPGHYGRVESEYLRAANDRTIVMAQIEHIAAVGCVDGIVAVDGLDVVFVGVNDLSGSMGLLGQLKHPRVLEAIDTVLAAGKAAGVPVGIAATANPEDSLAYVKAGFQFLGLPADYLFLSKAVDQLVGDVRAALP